MELEILRKDKRKHNELRPFNIKKLISNNLSQRVLFESNHVLLTCEIIGPTQQTSNFTNCCEFQIEITNPEQNPDQQVVLKRDIQKLLESVVCREVYPKQMIQVKFEIMKYTNSINCFCECVNSLFYATLLHGLRIKDCFTASYAAFINEPILDPTYEENQQKNFSLQLAYSVNTMKIIHFETEGEYTNDKISQLFSSTISACKQICSFIKELAIQQEEK